MTRGRLSLAEAPWYRSHVVYACHGGGRLLYIGASSSVLVRMQFHERNTPWWPEVERIYLRTFPTRPDAFAAERAAIAAKQPPHNVRHTTRFRHWRSAA